MLILTQNTYVWCIHIHIIHYIYIYTYWQPIGPISSIQKTTGDHGKWPIKHKFVRPPLSTLLGWLLGCWRMCVCSCMDFSNEIHPKSFWWNFEYLRLWHSNSKSVTWVITNKTTIHVIRGDPKNQHSWQWRWPRRLMVRSTWENGSCSICPIYYNIYLFICTLLSSILLLHIYNYIHCYTVFYYYIYIYIIYIYVSYHIYIHKSYMYIYIYHIYICISYVYIYDIYIYNYTHYYAV